MHLGPAGDAMKERPILFSAPMVRAILEGRKTVTRRPVKGDQIPKENADESGRLRWTAIGQKDARYGFLVAGSTAEECAAELVTYGACPYGHCGERLWVRESLGYGCEYGHYFAAGGTHGETVYLCSLFDNEETQTGYSYDGLLPERSVPSIHLHRRYSRILLEITDVRIERLQDIGREGCIAEGPDFPVSGHLERAWHVQFQRLWESTGGDWNANPWVWVVEFKRVTP